MLLIKEKLKNTGRILLSGFVLLFFIQCNGPRQVWNCVNDPSKDQASFQVGRAVELPSELAEISGVYDPKGGYIWCINDEDGVLYAYDAERKQIINKLELLPAGDYEALAMEGDSVFVLRSDGILYTLSLTKSEKANASTITGLPLQYELESLAIRNGKLFTICKGEFARRNYILYELIPKDGRYQAVPFQDWTSCLNEFITNQNWPPFSVNPSDLYFDSVDDRWYLLSTNPSAIYIFSENGQLILGYLLDNKIWPQPEGVCRSLRDGLIWITSEGKKKGVAGKAKLIVEN